MSLLDDIFGGSKIKDLPQPDFWQTALSSSTVTGRCPQCGGSASYSGSSPRDLNLALKEFYEIHKGCKRDAPPAKKNETKI